ncbi:NAD(P)-dependent dehydrogenase (short-subunit alcohol dehydrogenase family) [Kribbella amoyensis]|uniref:NAD(P)-dependent dehydrogenase (Short-subunit alcohol dehydrogenase family) n=1 Tax=Kribbella amoyensis TaxID=996641 RepID=A0A561BM34_9ACTN|nr:SDR family NAD(P)-dependent oxidoreductase [Kribbella amoyensis]TWD79941.1 NAD(P)-dependent dehydrogenase (short-subunit alcohol dehydrogenase family) [Kribbella amoyensis]
MTTTLITGANKGLGYEAARQLVALGHTVYLGTRDPARGQRAATELGARYVHLDVTDVPSIRAAAEQVQAEGGLDVLINNAGIPGAGRTAEEVTAEVVRAVYEVNVYGPVSVLNEFLPVLRKSSNPVVVNVSSGLGSLTVAADPEANAGAVPVWIPAPVYASSKAALNMLTLQFARLHPELRINTVDPGFTATDFNGHRGNQTVEEGAEIIVRLAQTPPEGPTGQYLSLTGTVPW